MEHVRFKKILSTTSHYGIIWKGIYKDKDCVVKMVILTSGLHYEKNSKDKGEKFFDHDNESPFLHSLFRERKAMIREKFDHEVRMIRKLNRVNLSPNLFHSFIIDTYEAHYGFIIMEELETTVKAILLQRDLTSKEDEKIERLIGKLHERGLYHGDLKPSNIGVNLNKRGQIEYLKLLDCAKVNEIQSRDDIKGDLETFHKHVRKNIQER